MSKSTLVGMGFDLVKLNEGVADGTIPHFPGKNGAKYVNFDVWINEEEVDRYGNNAAISISQTKEERDAKKKKVFIGNGKVLFSKSVPTAKSLAEGGGSDSQEDGDEIPF